MQCQMCGSELGCNIDCENCLNDGSDGACEVTVCTNCEQDYVSSDVDCCCPWCGTDPNVDFAPGMFEGATTRGMVTTTNVPSLIEKLMDKTLVNEARRSTKVFEDTPNRLRNKRASHYKEGGKFIK